MKLEDYHCRELRIEISIPYDKRSWGRIVHFFGVKKGAVLKKGSKAMAVSSILSSQLRSADYHYHFSANSLARKGKVIEIDISLHPNSSASKKRGKKGELIIDKLELWLLDFLGTKFQKRFISLRLMARFAFPKSSYNPLVPMPFKSPFEVPNGKSVLGELSIAGLKFKLENSKAGLSTLYFETFPDFVGITMLFTQTMILESGAVEQFLKGAQKIAFLFVKEEKKDVRKQV